MFFYETLFCKEPGWGICSGVLLTLSWRTPAWWDYGFILSSCWLWDNLHFPWVTKGRGSSCICQTAVGILSFWIWLGCHVPCIILNRAWREALSSCHEHLRELQMFRSPCARVKWSLVVCSRGSLSRWVWDHREVFQGYGWSRLAPWLYATLDMERQRRVLKALSCREIWVHLWRPLEKRAFFQKVIC